MLIVFVLAPLVAAVLLSLFRGGPDWLKDVIVAATTAAMAVLSYVALSRVWFQGMLLQQLGGGKAPLQLTVTLDGLSVFMLVIVNTLLLLLAVYSAGYMAACWKKWKYYVLFLLMAAGLNGVLIASDLFNLFVFSELAVIAAYIFASFFDEAENFEAAFKYAVMGSLSSLLILLAFALLYSRTGSLNMLAIAAHEGSRQTVFDLLVLVLLIAGFGLKSTLVPFHAWVPDAYAAAPSPVTALYSGAVSKVVGIYVLMRMAFNVIGITPAMLHIFTLLGIISMLVGVTLALYQWDFKRLLAYHSISQIGYIVLGIGLGTPLGIIGGLFHLLNHSVFKSLLFMNAGSIERAAETRNLKELGGLSARMPVTAGTSLVASMSISGIPPLNGFWSKLVIIIACVQARQYWFAFFAALASILTLSSFLKVQRYAFFGYLKDALKDIREAPAVMTVPMLLLAALCISLGLLLVPGLDRYFLGLAANTLLAGRDFSALFIRVTP